MTKFTLSNKLLACKSKESKKEGEAEGDYRQYDAEHDQPCEATSDVLHVAVFSVECLTSLFRVAEMAEQKGRDEQADTHDNIHNLWQIAVQQRRYKGEHHNPNPDTPKNNTPRHFGVIRNLAKAFSDIPSVIECALHLSPYFVQPFYLSMIF